MRSIADTMLAGGCVPNLGAIHNESIFVETGKYAGKTFCGRKETEEDLVLNTELGEDRRSKRTLYFDLATAPDIGAQDVIRTADGMRWNAVRNPGSDDYEAKFELREIAINDK